MSALKDAIESGEFKKHVDPLEARAAKLRAEMRLLQKQKALHDLQRQRDAMKNARAHSLSELAAKSKAHQLPSSNHMAEKNAAWGNSPFAKLVAKSKAGKSEHSGTTEHDATTLKSKNADRVKSPFEKMIEESNKAELSGATEHDATTAKYEKMLEEARKAELSDDTTKHDAASLNFDHLPSANQLRSAAKNAARVKSPFEKMLERSRGVKGEVSGTTEHGAVAAPLAVASVVVVCACVAVFAVIRRRQRDSAATAPVAEGYTTLV